MEIDFLLFDESVGRVPPPLGYGWEWSPSLRNHLQLVSAPEGILVCEISGTGAWDVEEPGGGACAAQGDAGGLVEGMRRAVAVAKAVGWPRAATLGRPGAPGP